MSYDPERIETAWQRRWESANLFAAAIEPGRPKYYVYNPAPYLTGSLHMGHVRNYAYGDFLARAMRLRGANVLYTIGFDAFGLPTEMAAIRNQCPPADWSRRCHAGMLAQLRRLGLAMDWGRSFITSDPRYYRWTQWIFLELHAHGLIYTTEATCGWCAGCETSLARSQIIDGRCWLCDGPVETRRTREWRLRVTPFLDDLLEGLDEMRDLNGLADQGQRLLIGKQSGVAVDLEIRPGDGRVTAFLARPDEWRQDCDLLVDARDEETMALLGGSERTAPGRSDRFTAVERATGREFPVVVVRARDPLFADQPRLAPRSGDEPAQKTHADGTRADAVAYAPHHPDLGDTPVFRPLTIYRQKDFSISRARFWGTPIPVVLCGGCGEVPVAPEDLPVVAPAVAFDPASGVLCRQDPDWKRRACPRCGAPAELDDLVMDCHVDALWHYYRPCAGADDRFLFDQAEMEYWMPVDSIQFGRDVIPFMLDLRLFTLFLHRCGRVPFREFCREVLAHGLVLHAGRKMSKHLGNVVHPGEIVERFGADSLRFYVLAQAEPRSDCDWSDDGIRRYHQLLSSYHAMLAAWTASATDAEGSPVAPPVAPPAASPAASPAPAPAPGFGKYTRIFLKKSGTNIRLLEKALEETRFDRYAAALSHLMGDMVFFWTQHRSRERDPRFTELWLSIVRDSLLYLAPVAPHLAEEGWRMIGEDGPMARRARLPEPGNARLRQLA